MSADNLQNLQRKSPDNTMTSNLTEHLSKVIVGKELEIKLAICCLLAGGHLLIEDVPGVGKTTLAHALAKVMGLEYQRIQFTSDLLPADILGVSIFSRDDEQFHFHPGPVFSQLLLADELNRATPKSQSALLEAMEEQQITVDGETHSLPSPFFVIATQNPLHQSGTYPLPESQLDRFMMSISLGYPDPESERLLLKGESREHLISAMKPLLDKNALLSLQASAGKIHASDPVLDYLQSVLAHSRQNNHYQMGLSPRAGLGLLAAARAWALLDERDYLLPDDVQAVLPAVAGHRLQALKPDQSRQSLIQSLLQAVPVP